MSRIMRYARGFAAFWWDFIVGDSIVLAIGGVGVLVLGTILVQSGYDRLAQMALPGIVIATLVGSLVRR